MKPDAPNEAGLHLFTSNRLETLAALLAGRLRHPLPSPFQPEIVVVRNKGMERWLKLQLAAQTGICANAQFPFPEAFGQQLFRKFLPDLPDESPLERDVLVWRILGVLPDLIMRPAFAPLRAYLGEEEQSDPRKRIQLCGRIANLFDQYLLFRPELILAWDEGRDEHWQALLWREIVSDLKQPHTAACWKRFGTAAFAGEMDASGLPPRISIFGISALPPFYLSLFSVLAAHLQINLFLLQPSQEYWGDITSAREHDRILRRQCRRDEPAFEAHLETGNHLLASLGYLGRDFLKLALDAGDWHSHEAFVAPGHDTLLHSIQSDILSLHDRGRSAEHPKLSVSTDDTSIQIHSCHSPLREMEVLHDQMLDWFQHDPALAPRDIVVMTPDIETYAPFVQAVFGSPEDPAHSIPFSVADRGARHQSHVIGTFLRLLELPESRLGASSVIALLETPAVLERFELSEADLEAIRGWVMQTHIRWGVDAEDRRRFDLPNLPGNTWREGVDRLLLGYALAGHDEHLFQGILPVDDVEGSAATVLGRFVEFFERLVSLMKSLRLKRPLDEWADTFSQLLNDFFAMSEHSAGELQIIRDALAGLRRQHKLSGFNEPISLAAVLERLAPVLEDDLHHSGFLTGGVTFCGLKPMRSVPFKIVCLVGMNDSAFPRPTQHLSFDLMAKAPRLGDRSTREDDRYLFLETLLAARERLHVSYVGQSIRDNAEAPPSVLVSELLDYIEQGYGRADGRAEKAGAAGESSPTTLSHVVVRHRLQAFSEDYFRPGHRLFSYSRENGLASESARLARVGIAPFISAPLNEPEKEFRTVALTDLAKFFANPAKYFLNQRLRIFLPRDIEGVEDREPFALDSLETFQFKQTLLDQKVRGLQDNAILPLALSGGQLPHGTAGKATFIENSAVVDHFLDRLQPYLAHTKAEPLEVNLELKDFQLIGRIEHRTDTGPLFYRCGKIRAADILGAWVHHVALNAIQASQTTMLLGEDSQREYSPPANALKLLQELVELYWRGLSTPLPFFPKSALAYAKAALKDEQRRKAGKRTPAHFKTPIQKALEGWEGDEHHQTVGERQDPHFHLVFRQDNPLDDEFCGIAMQVFGPILGHETRTDEIKRRSR